MYELEEFESSARRKRREKGSIRKALEDGRLQPIPLPLPTTVERRRQNGCDPRTKLVVSLVLLVVIAMLFYAVWRIRIIEEASESIDYDYRMIGEAEINDTDANDNNVDDT